MNFSAREFIHPEDQAALENLKSIPLFSTCIQMFMKAIPERFLHGLSMAQKIRLGPEQLPELYQHLPPTCAALGIEEPEFYLEMNPFPNAYTYGDTRPMITVTSGLVESLEPEELRTVIAHECGHIVCRHVLYHTMADMIVKFGSAFLGLVSIVSEPVKLALLYWYRRSELSADRAAAVVLKGAQPVVDVMVRLAGGPKSITGKINLDLYMQQAETYDKLQESRWDKVLQNLAVMGQDHPFLAVRVREITRWCESPQFRRLLQVADEETTAPRCPGCAQPARASWKFCNFCGHPLTNGSTASNEEEPTHG